MVKCLTFLPSLLLLLASQVQAAEKTITLKIKIKPTAVVFRAILPNGKKSTGCLNQDGKIYSGSVSKNRKHFTTLKAKLTPQILKLQNEIKDTQDDIELALLKTNLKKIKTQIKESDQACLLAWKPEVKETPCAISVFAQDIVIQENNIEEVNLSATSTCNQPLNLEITTKPKAGTAYIEDNKIYYRAGFGESSDSFFARACQATSPQCSEPVEIRVIGTASEYVGRADELSPYRNKITRAEARHLIMKLALNDFEMLTDDLLKDGAYDLTALVNKMLDPHYVSQDLKKQLEVLRDGLPFKNPQGVPQPQRPLWDPWPVPYKSNFFTPLDRFSTPVLQHAAFDRFQHGYFMGYNPNNGPYGTLHYAYYYTPAIAFMRPRYLSPTWELMTNIWYGHFGTAVHNLGGQWDELQIRDYIELINKNALGNFKDLVLGINREACKSSGTGRGMLCDGASAIWLNNSDNTYLKKNQNYAREFMELYLLGPFDLVTGKPNYTEKDVEASTAFLSGYTFEVKQSPILAGPQKGTLVDRFELVWKANLHDFGEYTAFAGTPYEFSGSHTPTEFAEHLIDNHPGMPRFIAGKLFRMLVYRDPSEKLVQALADRFKKSNFDIADLIFAIATSEAMFSKKAATPTCVKEPLRAFTETMRNTKLPYIDNWIFESSTTHLFNGINAYTVAHLLEVMTRLGETPLLYESVFSHDYCGRKPEEHGQGWLASIYLLQRTKIFIEYFATADWANRTLFDFNNMLPLMQKPGETIFAVTPSRVIDYFANMYNIPLSDNERTVLFEYLSTRLNAQDIPEQIGWNPTDKNLVSEKLSGLTVIFASMSQSNVH